MDLRSDSIAALIEAAKQSGRKLSELVLEQQAVQMEQSADELYEIMRKSYAVMAASVEEGKAPGVRSASGLSGGDAYRMARAEREGNVQSANGTRQWAVSLRRPRQAPAEFCRPPCSRCRQSVSCRSALA